MDVPRTVSGQGHDLAGLTAWLRGDAGAACRAAEAEGRRPGCCREGRDALPRYAADLYEAGGMPGHARWCERQLFLGYLFGVSDSTALRAVRRWLPLPERSGRDTMRMPDPGRGRRKDLPRLLAETPGLAVMIDTFEQCIQWPKRQQRA